MADKIRVGIVGASPTRSFASISHVPALQALPDFEIVAVCTSSQASADAAAKHYGVPLAFADPAKLAAHPNVDLVTVTVKVPDHYVPVMAAIDAGKPFPAVAAWQVYAGGDASARRGGTERHSARRWFARRGLARDRYVKDTDRRRSYRPRFHPARCSSTRVNWGKDDRSRLPDRSCQRRKPHDDHRRA